MPLYLNTRNPNVKSIKDFTEKDRIALPAVKVSIQAVTLQMAAEKAFGEGQQGKLDALTVSMSHPDAQVALLSGASEITAHFSSPPFQYQQLKRPGIRTVLSSYDVLGGPATFNVVWTTSKFRSENPKLYDAVVKALDEATAMINSDKKAAAEAYLRISKDKDTVADILAMLNDPAIVYTTTPQNVMKYVDFMAKVGVDQGQARLVEGSVLPEHPRRGGELMRDAAGADALVLPDLAAIRAAHARIAPHVHRTPVLRCSAIDAEAGARLYFKCENFQKVGAFKARGATNAVFSLQKSEALHGVVTHSSGNHGAALAYAARRRGIAAWVVMPENSSVVKQENVRRFGGTIRFCAPNVAAREAACAAVRAETGATMIHPFDDDRVIAGQATAAVELARGASRSRHRDRPGRRWRLAVGHRHRRAIDQSRRARVRRGARERRRRRTQPSRRGRSSRCRQRRRSPTACARRSRRARLPRSGATSPPSAPRARRRSCARCA